MTCVASRWVMCFGITVRVRGDGLTGISSPRSNCGASIRPRSHLQTAAFTPADGVAGALAKGRAAAAAARDRISRREQNSHRPRFGKHVDLVRPASLQGEQLVDDSAIERLEALRGVHELIEIRDATR